MFENALIYRQWKTAFRLRKLVAFLGALAAILLTAYSSLYSHYVLDLGHHSYRTPHNDWVSLGAGMLRLVLSLEGIVCVYGALALSAEAIGGERVRKTHDLLVTLPLGPSRKLHGLLIGHNLYPLLGYILLTPLVVIFGSMAGVLMQDLAVISLLLLAVVLCYGLVGLAVSSSLGSALAVFIAIMLFAVNVGLSSALSGYQHGKAVSHRFDYRQPITEIPTDISLLAPLLPLTPFGMGSLVLSDAQLPIIATFYGKTISWQTAAVMWLAYLGVLAYLVARQKLSRPSLPPLPRALTLLFFALLEALLLGFFWQADFNGMEATHAWCTGFFVLLLLWSLATQLTYPPLLEWTRRFGHKPWQLLAQAFRLSAPNGLLLLLMWFLAADGLWILRRNSTSHSEAMATIITFASLLGFLLQANVLFLLGEVFWKRAGKAGGLVIFIMLTVIPVAIAAASDNESIAAVSAPYALALLDPTNFKTNDIIANFCAGWGLFALFLMIYLYWSVSTAWEAKRESRLLAA